MRGANSVPFSFAEKEALTINSELSINALIRTKRVQRQLRAIRGGIDMILKELEQIDKGCPDCGYHLVEISTIEFLEGDKANVTCSECGGVYVISK